MSNGFLPISKQDMIDEGIEQLDFVYVCGDAYVDHPSFGHAIIARLLQAHGYTVGIISQPDWKDDESISILGVPRLGFLVSAGNMDSMVNHYSVSKKRRAKDSFTPGGVMGKRPDYATVVYCNLIRHTYKKIPIIIGGIEASLRRMAHYDYWSNKVKRSILLDSGADLISYGMGERSIIEIADALASGMDVKDITFIDGTVFKTKDRDIIYDAIELPDYDVIKEDKREFARSFYIQYCNTDPFCAKRLVEPYDNSTLVVQNPPQKPLSQDEMDEVYALPYMRTYHPSYEEAGGVPAISEVKFSLISNRGCFGGCNFCALTFHQGRIIQTRSHESIIEEAKLITQDKDFKGYGQYQKIRDIIRSDPSRRVVVVSAAGKRSAGDNKITDLLYLCYAHLQYGVSCDGIYQMIRERYGDIHRELGLRVDLEGVLDRLRSQMEQGISRDELVSRGEYLSALLMADYLGFTFVDAAQWLFFHYDGTIDQEKSYAALRALARDKCVVIPGFYGLMPDGKLRTLTRGGSDITGALAAAALDADVYENWTDVSGILMADPRIVDHPRSIERATYSELRQLSYSGAQVLHEMTIFPVREKNIPLNIRNTNEPDHPGTLITESFVEAPNPERFVTGIAGKCDFSIVTVSKKGLSGAVGTLRAILEVFENNSIPVAHTPSGIDCISLAMPTEALTPNQYSLLDELRSEIRPDSIQINDHIAVIAVVGRKMAFRVGTSGKIFAALGKAGINIRMISQGPDEQAIILGVDNKDYADAIRVLYNAFVK